jgi:hypothetical protein
MLHVARLHGARNSMPCCTQSHECLHGLLVQLLQLLVVLRFRAHLNLERVHLLPSACAVIRFGAMRNAHVPRVTSLCARWRCAALYGTPHCVASSCLCGFVCFLVCARSPPAIPARLVCTPGGMCFFLVCFFLVCLCMCACACASVRVCVCVCACVRACATPTSSSCVPFLWSSAPSSPWHDRCSSLRIFVSLCARAQAIHRASIHRQPKRLRSKPD